MEHPAQMDVVGDVAAAQAAKGLAKVPCQDFHGHGSLLLAHARQEFQPPPEFRCSWAVGPEATGVTLVPAGDDTRGLNEPLWHNVDESMQFGLLLLLLLLSGCSLPRPWMALGGAAACCPPGWWATYPIRWAGAASGW